MVDRQLRRRGIDDECVLSAMAEVPRERFLPDDVRDDAYRDGAVPIGEGQTMSQPWIVACMTMLAEPRPEKRVLEVGTGSGYGAAVLSRLCAHVVTIEATQAEIAQLAGASRESASRFLAKLERAGLITTGRGRVVVHDPESLRNYIY